jgi:hypothetical protein
MKPTPFPPIEWLLIGVSGERVGVSFLMRKNGNFASFSAKREELEEARRWKTRAGIERFIKREREAGSGWTYALLPVEPAKI